MVARPMVTVLAIDPQNPLRYLEVRGNVIEITEDGAVDHINQLGQLYTGKAFYPPNQPPQETRVIYKIKPTHVTTH
jgi:hypothetical protein